MATPAEVISRLLARGQTVATCESLSGGLICAALTSVPGSSQVVRGGLITYASDLKTRLAGVSPSIIRDCGVVSAEVARAMAVGARGVCDATWAVAVTGVAGPGPSEGVPAGTVWLGVAGPDVVHTTLLHLTGERAAVRTHVVEAALGELVRLLDAPADVDSPLNSVTAR